jgi:hypothetical protein
MAIENWTRPDDKTLMEKFNRIFGAVEAAAYEIQAADPNLSVDEVMAKAERRVALKYPGECPLSWFHEQQKVN